MLNCISCGMPMEKKEDFSMQNTNKPYCVHCSDEKGNLLSYEEILENWSNFLIKIDKGKITKKEAVEQVKEKMKNLPAWQEKNIL